MDLLFSEFIGDYITTGGKHLVDQRKDALMTLINILVEAFESVEPIKHQLFKNCNQMHLEGCQKLIGCYNAGLERLKAIYRQEVLKIEPINTKGRRAKEVIVSKVKDAKKAEKEIKVTDKKAKEINLQGESSTKRNLPTINKSNESFNLQIINLNEEQTINSTVEGNPNIQESLPPIKKVKIARHITSQSEKEILQSWMTANSPTNEEIEQILVILKQHWDGWDRKKIRDYWSHHKPKLE